MVSTAIEGKSGSIPQRGVKAKLSFLHRKAIDVENYLI